MKTYYTELEAAKAKLELRKLEKVELGLLKDADKLYKKIVDKAQAQAQVILKVVSTLDKLTTDAKKLQKMEEDIEKAAKDLGIEPPETYAASTWVSDLKMYADKLEGIGKNL